jgi:hypothetical protein
MKLNEATNDPHLNKLGLSPPDAPDTDLCEWFPCCPGCQKRQPARDREKRQLRRTGRVSRKFICEGCGEEQTHLSLSLAIVVRRVSDP